MPCKNTNPSFHRLLDGRFTALVGLLDASLNRNEPGFIEKVGGEDDDVAGTGTGTGTSRCITVQS